MIEDKQQPEQDPSEGSRKPIERELERMPDTGEKGNGKSDMPRQGRNTQ